MADSPLKRFREQDEIEDSKRHKSYNQILSLLEEGEEDETTQDLSSLITTLQQEISSNSAHDDPVEIPNPETDRESLNFTTIDFGFSSIEDIDSSSSPSSSNPLKLEDEEGEKDRVMKHLLEASDDELGIPSREVGVGEVVQVGGLGGGVDGGEDYPFWDLEDEAANYYTLLQSELFM